MRPIKFRGKIVETDNEEYDGSWVYGDLSQVEVQRNGKYLIWDESRRYSSGFYVEERTIGQYTGLRDANGREIYEGDVLRLEDKEKAYGVVVWHPKGYFAIDYQFGKCDLWDYDYPPLGEMLYHRLRSGKLLRFIVCGNIFDNPPVKS